MSEFAKKNDLVPPCGVPVFSDDLAMDLRIMCDPIESDARKWYSLARVLGQMSEQLGVELHDEDEPESDEPESPFNMDVALDEIWLKALKKRESSMKGGEMRERFPERLSASDCDMWVYDEVCKNESPRGGWIAYLVLAIVFILSALLYRYVG